MPGFASGLNVFVPLSTSREVIFASYLLEQVEGALPWAYALLSLNATRKVVVSNTTAETAMMTTAVIVVVAAVVCNILLFHPSFRVRLAFWLLFT